MNIFERLLHPARFDEVLAENARLRAENDELRSDSTGGTPWAEVEAVIALRVTAVLDRVDLVARTAAQEQPPTGLRGFADRLAREKASGMRAAGERVKRAIVEERERLAPRGDEAA